MAKDSTTIDKDLYDGLQQARKKKPRYYALLAKGAEVLGMIVQKKVISDGVVQKKKTECKGTTLIVQGVCIGEGAELKLEVLDKEPSILPKKVKDFIEEQTDHFAELRNEGPRRLERQARRRRRRCRRRRPGWPPPPPGWKSWPGGARSSSSPINCSIAAEPASHSVRATLTAIYLPLHCSAR